jgi:hypothetical protein
LALYDFCESGGPLDDCGGFWRFGGDDRMAQNCVREALGL